MTEKELIIGCQKEKPLYQRELVLRYSAMLLTVSRRYTPERLGPEDILQDAFIKIFKSIHQFDDAKGSLEGWMRKIVINTALKKLKRKFVKEEVPVEAFQDPLLLPSIYEQMDAEDVMRLIAALPDGYRQVFNLYVIEGYSHKEIASLLGIGETSSRSNLSRAKTILRNKLNNQKIQESWLKIS